MEGSLMKGPESFKTGWQREHCSLCVIFFSLQHVVSLP